MVLYDVILVGFPDGPNVGDTPAQALARVFGIPQDSAARMAEAAPTVVRSAVPEDVARKYFNAFAYIGASCEFRISQGVPTDTPRDQLVVNQTMPPTPRADEAPSASVSAGPRSTAEMGPRSTAEIGPRSTAEMGPRSTAELSGGFGIEESAPPVPDTTSAPNIHARPDYADLETSASWSDVGAAGFLESESAPSIGPAVPAADATLSPTSTRVPAPDATLNPTSTRVEPVGVGEGPGPSVAEVRAAWEAGKDITLEPDSGEPSRSQLGGWDPWMESELPDADFPSGVALDENPGPRPAAPSVDVAADGTRVEPPRQSRLVEQLAQAKAAVSDALFGEPIGDDEDPSGD